MQQMRAIRNRRGLSLSALEEKTGISASLLSRYETGKYVPSVEKGRLVARALGVSLDVLVGDQHETNADTPSGACVLPPENTETPLAVSGKSSASGVR